MEEARASQAAFESARASPAMAERYIHNNKVTSILEVGAAMLKGELAYREGNYDVAWSCLEEAVALDDGLAYDEPWGWMIPARHAYAALLAEQGQHEKAIGVYKQDLAQGGGRPGPDNPWALCGLLASLEAMAAGGGGGAAAEEELAAEIEQTKDALAKASATAVRYCVCIRHGHACTAQQATSVRPVACRAALRSLCQPEAIDRLAAAATDIPNYAILCYGLGCIPATHCLT